MEINYIDDSKNNKEFYSKTELFFKIKIIWIELHTFNWMIEEKIDV